MSSLRACLTERQVAALFHHRVAWLLRERDALEARGFPKPIVPGSYDPLAVAAWFDLQMPPALRALAAPQSLNDADQAEQRAAVDARLRANGARIIADLGERRRRKGNAP
jgi:hypothetical protein